MAAASGTLLKVISFSTKPPSRDRPSPRRRNVSFLGLQTQSRPTVTRSLKIIRLQSVLKPEAAPPSLSHSSSKGRDIFGGVARVTLTALQRQVTLAVMMLVLLTAGPYAALAASGGRMGGKSFSSSSSRKSKGFSTRRHSSSFRSFSTPPRHSSSYRSSFFSRRPHHVRAYNGLDRFHDFLLEIFYLPIGVTVGFFIFILINDWNVEANAVMTVINLQIGLLCPARALQRELDQIAETVDTSTSEGLSKVLKETTSGLLRHLQHWSYVYKHCYHKESMEVGEKWFYEFSNEERGKFVGGRHEHVNTIEKLVTSQSSEINMNYVMVIILVAAEGVHKLPSIECKFDLWKTLEKLVAIPSSKLLGVEVIWNPPNENDTISCVPYHYPEVIPL